MTSLNFNRTIGTAILFCFASQIFPMQQWTPVPAPNAEAFVQQNPVIIRFTKQELRRLFENIVEYTNRMINLPEGSTFELEDFNRARSLRIDSMQLMKQALESAKLARNITRLQFVQHKTAFDRLFINQYLSIARFLADLDMETMEPEERPALHALATSLVSDFDSVIKPDQNLTGEEREECIIAACEALNNVEYN